MDLGNFLVMRQELGLLAVFGGAPLFFYLIHLYGLHLLNLAALALFGANQGDGFGVSGVGWLWLLALNPLSPYRLRWRGQGLHAREPVTWLDGAVG